MAEYKTMLMTGLFGGGQPFQRNDPRGKIPNATSETHYVPNYSEET